MKTCNQCNAEYVPNDYRQKFCSKSCSVTYSNSNRVRKMYQSSNRTCRFCGGALAKYQKKYCSSTCDGAQKKKDTEMKILAGKKVAVSVLRNYLLTTRPNVCEICKGDSWLGHPMPLTMDHIDGKATNNQLDNLRLICPNCDRFTPTFGYRNKGNGRQSLGLKRHDKYDK